MKRFAWLTTLPIFALALPMFGQTSGNCGQPFEAPLASGTQVTMDLRAGDVEIIGTSKQGVRVSCDSSNDPSTKQVRISFAAGHLRVSGGPDNIRRFHYRIEVPTQSAVVVRCSAGNVSMSGLQGDKDVELKAGDLTISVGPPESYRVVEAQVLAGDLKANAWGVKKDGLGQNFRKDNPRGQYRLKANVLAGNLILK